MNGFKAAALEWVRTDVYHHQEGDQEMQKPKEFMDRLAERERSKAAHRAAAVEVWAKMDANKRHGIRFGLFPVEIMDVVKEKGLDQHTFTCALMDVAEANGGMRA